MPLQPGKIIAGNIRLVRVLGAGGMGSVWMAEHLGLKAHVAVKFMSVEIAARPESRERFEREATAAAQIKSPHVVNVTDHGITPDGLPYIVMEFLEGEDLHELLSRVQVLEPATVGEIVSQVCKALARAHVKGIIHRDIKPDNIFLLHTDDHELFVKLLDFGVAKQLSENIPSMTETGAVPGTPHYMSPEQVVSPREVDHRTDLWSLAVVVYRALTGRVPFNGHTLAGLGIAIHAGVFEPPSRLRRGLPASIDLWMARALARDRESRFSSAKEMADELRRAVGIPSLLPPSSQDWRAPPMSSPAPSTPISRAPSIGPDAPTRLDRLPSSATSMDATLTDAKTLVTRRPTPVWKPALLMLATAFAITLAVLAWAALRQSSQPPQASVAAPPAEPSAAKTAAPGVSPAQPTPLSPTMLPLEPQADPARTAQPQRHRAQPPAPPSSSPSSVPAPEPEDYGF